MTSAPRPRPPTPTPPVAQWVTLTGPVRSNTFRRPGVPPRVLPPPGTPGRKEVKLTLRKNSPVGPVAVATPALSPQAPARGGHTCQLGASGPVPVTGWFHQQRCPCQLAPCGGYLPAAPWPGTRTKAADSWQAGPPGTVTGWAQTKAPLCAPARPPGPLSPRSLLGGGGRGERCLAGGSLPQLPCLHPTSVPVGEWPQGPASGCRPGAGGQQPSGPPSSPSSGLPLPRLRAPTPCSGHPLAQGPLAAHQGLRGFLSHEVSVVSLPPGRALSKLPVSPGAGPGGASRAASRRAEQETGPPASAQAQGHPCPSALIVRQRRPFGLCSPDKACVLCPPPRKPGPALAESILV